MWSPRPLVLAGVLAALLVGCKSHPLTDFRPLDQAGMWSSAIEDLKKLNVTDDEVAQIALVNQAHIHKHYFASATAVRNLSGAGFSESEILDIARADKLDAVSGDAVT